MLRIWGAIGVAFGAGVFVGFLILPALVIWAFARFLSTLTAL